MGIFVKICGIASERDVAEVAALAPDAMGFVLWPSSKRHAPPEKVTEWARRIPSTILKVGVFVDAAPEEVRETLRRTGLDVAQLHGKERADDFRSAAYRVWRALPLAGDVEGASTGWRVDAFLVDTYSDQLPGGTGKVGDWEAARRFVRFTTTPVLLAGGLTPDNVADAIRTVRPWGVDVSSGVEERPGRKDLGRVKAFIEQCRAV